MEYILINAWYWYNCTELNVQHNFLFFILNMYIGMVTWLPLFPKQSSWHPDNSPHKDFLIQGIPKLIKNWTAVIYAAFLIASFFDIVKSYFDQ